MLKVTYKYSVFHPEKKDFEYRNSIISEKEVMKIVKNYPWVEKLKF